MNRESSIQCLKRLSYSRPTFQLKAKLMFLELEISTNLALVLPKENVLRP